MPATEPSAPPAIEVSNLVKRYGAITAVDGISFEVRPGEIVGFLGPNGAGKSTTMRILTGCLPATHGVVRICGHSVATEPGPAKRRIGYMPENNPLPDDLRVAEYLHFRGRLKEMPGPRLRDRVEEVLEGCDLKRVRRRLIGLLSKGYRQRVGVADAILSEPEVIIMDEPTIGLDPHQILMIRDLISRLRGRMSVIISSHILPEIEVTCDRVIIINGGRIVAQGTPADLRGEYFGAGTHRMETTADAGQLEAALAGCLPDLRIHGVTGPDPDGFRTATVGTSRPEGAGEAIYQAASRAGLRMRALAPVEPSLEDVFLAATRRSWDVLMRRPGENGAPSLPPDNEAP